MKSRELLLNTLTDKSDRINGYSHDVIGDNYLFTSLENPMRANAFMMPDDEKKERIAGHFTAIMEILGLDLNDDSLQGTPDRVARMYVDEIFSGLNPKSKPQVQEHLTNQIAHELMKVLNTQDVAVIIDAKHLCVSSRGVEDHSSSTITTFYGGKFKSPQNISELQHYIHHGI